MTPKDFLAQPPITVTIHGKCYTMVPTVLPSGLCCYRSETIELFQPTPFGHIRIKGRPTFTAWSSRQWPRQ